MTEASISRLRWGCNRKTPYHTLREAALKARLKVECGAPPLFAYECPYCAAWHLTSSDRYGDNVVLA